MAYYIAPLSECNVNVGEMIVYRVVQRLRDFKPENGKKYRVFKSKRHMQESWPVPIYIGKAGKLKKCDTEFVWRF